MSQRGISYVVPKLPPPKGGSKTQNGRFQSKIALRLKKVWRKFSHKVSLCEYCLRQSCRAFIDLTILVKMIDGGHPLNVNFALSKLLLGAAAVLSRIVTNALFASQLLQWNIKLLIMFIKWVNWCVWMHYMIADEDGYNWHCMLMRTEHVVN